MKKIYSFLTLLIFTTISFAQGISVQGIARDNASSAITDTNLTFTFSITEEDNTVMYAETQGIKTDHFGVFSHVIRTGNPITNTFDDIDFGVEGLKLKVSVTYNSEDIEVYDQTLQYTPYAHHAKNGVPTGSILPFAGTEAPDGWVLCNGQSLEYVDGAGALKELIGNNAPDLRGLFLRGTGTSALGSQYVGPDLLATQTDENKEHTHGVGSLTIPNGGAHTNSFQFSYRGYDAEGGGGIARNRYTSDTNDGIITQTTSLGGEHTHTINGSVASTGGAETRPVNYGVNYIIKL
ncbi:tail fiber protein [uncultured Polaribacter sp.]|uniref:tail fiber protein n=1 Tax=uncultured Polaribacter sp. TaxID=174711 RepID=UPI0026334E98|nr:tail fiber protein [uncultured Polaribacter sp.]